MQGRLSQGTDGAAHLPRRDDGAACLVRRDDGAACLVRRDDGAACLVRRDDGAAMVFGVFFAVFLVAMVFYLYGLTAAMVYRERVQDAADAIAFSGALVSAKGMNILALINMAMAAVLAVLVALKVVEILIIAAMVIIAAVGWATGGGLYSLLAPLAKFEKKIHKAATKYEDKVLDPVLEALHNGGDAVKSGLPALGMVRTYGIAKHYGMELGASVPASFELPVEDDTFDLLCSRAGEMVGTVVTLPIRPMLGDDLTDDVSRGFGNGIGAAAQWFCGDGGGEQPSFNFANNMKKEYPISPEQKQCEAQADAERDSDAFDESPDWKPADDEPTDQCRTAERKALASMPNARGECRRGQSLCAESCEGSACPMDRNNRNLCSSQQQSKWREDGGIEDCHAFDERTHDARHECAPASGTGEWWYRRRPMTRTHVFHAPTTERLPDGTVVQHEAYWEALEPEPGTAVLAKKDFPCARDYSRDTSRPVCTRDHVCPDPYALEADGQFEFALLHVHGPHWRDGQEAVERWTDIEEVLRCTKELPEQEKKEIEEKTKLGKKKENEDGEGGDGGGDSDSKVPFRLAKDAWLGGPDFQVRGVSVGKSPDDTGGRAIDIARWGRGDGEGPALNELLTAAGRIGAGQGEFYFDWTGIEDGGDRAEASKQSADDNVNPEWLWYMNWRARLRPFRFQMDGTEPEDSDSSEGRGDIDVQGELFERCDVESCREVLSIMGGGGGDGGKR